jgi:toxin ParE1/3/4
MNYKISVKAAEDIEKIWLFTLENWSKEQADRYFTLLFEEIQYLASNPSFGKDIHQIRKNYRFFKVKSHLIFYKYSAKQNLITIMRILHNRMNFENRLRD